MKVRNRHNVSHYSPVFGAMPVGEFEMPDALAAQAIAGKLVDAVEPAAAVVGGKPIPRPAWKVTPPKDEEETTPAKGK